MTNLSDIPAAAIADPLTSRLAAADITASGQRHRNVERVAAAVARFPNRTSRELAAVACPDTGCDRYEFARRLPEAEALGLVKRAAPRKCRESMKLALVWLPVTDASAYDADMESR